MVTRNVFPTGNQAYLLREDPASIVKLKQLLNELNNDPIILGGDFNCTVNPGIDRSSKKEPDTRTSLCLDKLTHRFKLVDAWRYHQGNTRHK